MDIEKIRSLAALITEFGLEELKLEDGNGKITLRRPCAGVASTAPVYSETPVPVPSASDPVETAAAETVTANSTMVGTFYAAPAPDEPPFVAVGQRVRAGDVLCIVEAMKMMNEIHAEYDGVIVKCLAKNEQLVEYDQPLFEILCE